MRLANALPLLFLGVFSLACSSSSSGGSGDGDGGSDSTSASSGTSTGSGMLDGEVIDCSWFTMPDNCWATTVAKATACAPPGVITDDPSIPNNVGLFAADRLSCAYDDGTTVEFAEPVPDPDSPEMLPFADYVWTFSVKDSGGAACVSIDETDKDFTVHLAEGDFSTSLVGSSSDFQEQIVCPDGKKYLIPYSTLTTCWEGFDNGPTAGFFNAGSFVTYELYGGGFEEMQLFLCK